MESIKVKRAITVRAIVTDGLKKELVAEIQEAVKKLESEIQQLEFQSKRAMFDLEKQDPRQMMAFRQQVEMEKQKRGDAKTQLLEKLKEVAKLEMETEIIQGQLEGDVEVRMGDYLPHQLSAQIVLRDGVIVEMREGDEEQEAE